MIKLSATEVLGGYYVWEFLKCPKTKFICILQMKIFFLKEKTWLIRKTKSININISFVFIIIRYYRKIKHAPPLGGCWSLWCIGKWINESINMWPQCILHPLKTFECFQFIIFITTFFLDFFFYYMFHLYLNFLKKDISYIRDCRHLVDVRGWCIAQP